MRFASKLDRDVEHAVENGITCNGFMREASCINQGFRATPLQEGRRATLKPLYTRPLS